MTLVALETLRPAVQPNVTLLRLRTDTGLVGIGEAFFAAGAVALGAVDLALWDLLGRRAGLPVVDLLGGAVRESIPSYTTCAGSGYVGSS